MQSPSVVEREKKRKSRVEPSETLTVKVCDLNEESAKKTAK